MNATHSVAPSRVVFSTQGMSSKEAFERWFDLYSHAVAPMQMLKSEAEGEFSASARVQSFGGLRLFSTSHSQSFTRRNVRTKKEIAQTREDALAITILGKRSGLHSHHGGNDADMSRMGDWALYTPQDPVEVVSGPGKHESYLLVIPREKFGAMQQFSGDNFGRLMSSRHLPNLLVANYVQTLAENGRIADAATGDALARNLMDLVSVALNATPEAGEAGSQGVASGMLLAITQHLDAQYMNQDLSPSLVAARFGISTRHLHWLFERTGTTFMESLYERRLQHARRMLKDPLCRHLSMLDIAYECGFQHPTHFARRFREMFGQTPSEAREQR